jgi:predicted nuclease with RNAse H fold
MLELKDDIFVDIDLAANRTTQQDGRSLRNKVLETCLLHKDVEILESLISARSALTVIDAPLSLPATGSLRKADRHMASRGLRIFSANVSNNESSQNVL